MRVINQAILVTGQIEDDSSHLTLFEKFKDFTENLAWLSKEDSYARLMTNIISIINSGRKKINDSDPAALKNQETTKFVLAKRKKLINDFFRDPTITNAA